MKSRDISVVTIYTRKIALRLGIFLAKFQALLGVVARQLAPKCRDFSNVAKLASRCKWPYCLTKCALENKLLNPNCWSWYHVSQKKLPHPLILVYCIHKLWEVCCSIFIGHPVYIYIYIQYHRYSTFLWNAGGNIMYIASISIVCRIIGTIFLKKGPSIKSLSLHTYMQVLAYTYAWQIECYSFSGKFRVHNNLKVNLWKGFRGTQTDKQNYIHMNAHTHIGLELDKSWSGARPKDVNARIVWPGTHLSTRCKHLKSWHLPQPIVN